MMIIMRIVGLIAAILALSMASPLSAAHGANDFSIILREGSMQPNEAEVMQNDTVTFYNVADNNRTIRVDLDGDGVYDQRCETEPWNSSSIRDECTFSIGWENWKAGTYHLDVFSNETLWRTLNLSVAHDYHEELGPPQGYTFNNEIEVNELDDENDTLQDGLLLISIALLAASGIVWTMRRNRDE